MDLKKISVITPAFNRRDMLETAIKNVMTQDYPNLEHIVVDGGSSDGTRELLTRYPQVRSFSGPDHGMYDALNKGIQMSTGEIVGFLNTDDLYTSDIFREIASKFEDESVMAVAGCAVVLAQTNNGSTEIIERYSPRDQPLLVSSTIGSNYFNAWFFHRLVFDKIGGFDIRYRIAGDREFMLRFSLSHLRYVTFEKVVYQYLQHSGSLTFHYDIEKRDQVTREHLAMTDFHLKKREISSLERNMISQLRTNETVDIALRAIKQGNPWKFFKWAYEGMSRDPLWMFKFAKAPLAFRSTNAVNLINTRLKKSKRNE